MLAKGGFGVIKGGKFVYSSFREIVDLEVIYILIEIEWIIGILCNSESLFQIVVFVIFI